MRLKLSLTIGAAFAALATARPVHAACNGHSELCSRRYSNITFVGAHDSPFVGDDIADNQEVSIAEQLELGVRFLQGQTHIEDGTIRLCHTLCFLRDAGPLEEMLTPVKTFLDSNPNEVVTLLLTNQDGVEGTAFDAVFKGTGLDQYAYVPEDEMTLDQWPTLGDLIARNKRLVVFMDYPKDPSVPYIINEFTRYIAETPFEFGDLRDLSFCPVDRPPRANVQDRMLLMNHWLQTNESGIYIPQRCMAETTNSEEYIMRHVRSCRGTLTKEPNFVLLDWVDVGDAMLVQDSLNGFSPKPTRHNTAITLEKCDDELVEMMATPLEAAKRRGLRATGRTGHLDSARM